MSKQILIMDDDIDNFTFFYAALKQLPSVSYICAYADSAQKGLDMLKYLSPSFIFIDYSMPCINGLEVLMHLRRERPLSSMKKILMSNIVTPDLELHARLLGADEVMEKPETMNLFVSNLKKMLLPSILFSAEQAN